MKFNSIFLSVLILIMFISCSNSNKTKFVKNENIPQFIKTDTLINTHNVEIVDTSETGKPRKIQFVNPEDTTSKIEKQYYESGKIFIEGELKNGKREGKWLAWYENGMLWSMGYYKNGKREGQNEAYYDNGKLRYSKFYKDDKSDGLAKFFDPHGNLIAEVEFRNDSIKSQKNYYKENNDTINQ